MTGYQSKKAAALDKLAQPEQEPVKIDGNTSDGYHTFNELYEFRKAYNAVLFNEWSAGGKCSVHKSWRHHDGELCFGGGWFIVVAVLPEGQISNHYEARDWDLFAVPETECALFEFDGHTSSDVVARLKAYTTPPAAQPAPVQEPRCAVIVEVFGKDWRLDYMSLPVGKHKLYTQQYIYTTPPAAQPVGQAPCVRHCEATAFQIVIKNLRNEIERMKAAQPEPVMYGIQAADGRYGNWAWSQKSHAETSALESPARFGYKVIGYYTAPLAQPAQRTWVDLTDEDEIDWDGGDLKSLIKAIEAKLKEKNT